METALATLVRFGEAPPERTAAWLAGAVTRHASLAETVRDAELIVEAIIERPDAKRALYAELDDVAPAEAIWASNTSYFDVFPLIPERRQRRAIIAHWYTPPSLVDLRDLAPGPRCETEAVARGRATAAALGPGPIVMWEFVPRFSADPGPAPL